MPSPIRTFGADDAPLAGVFVCDFPLAADFVGAQIFHSVTLKRIAQTPLSKIDRDRVLERGSKIRPREKSSMDCAQSPRSSDGGGNLSIQ